MAAPIRILIVDDHELARRAMRLIVSADPAFEIVGEATNGQEALELTEKWMPDLILMDIIMPGMDGLEATKQIKERFPYVKIVVVTVSDDVSDLFEAFKKGAQGYLIKNIKTDLWCDYLKAVANDDASIPKEIALRILSEFKTSSQDRPSPTVSGLTRREQETLVLVAKGYSNREIAEQLGISEYTVKNHLKNILQKLHLSNRVQLARYAYEQGFVGSEDGE
ncbi:MAG: DNA-binding response regulator [Bacillaceae bacterium G1]|nr:DNA-binding response regulator [Bacillota bacterium]OJF17218.1 MAG: DNA-binding response regulator [Bacillaceae bacterium G1]